MLSNYKGGFFERMFRTTSEEYRVFKATLLAFNDEDSKGYGDIDNLEGATRAYLYHKLPNFKETDELPKDEDIRNLSGTSKRRVELCINVLKAVQEQRRQDEMSSAFKNMNLFSDIKDQDEEVLEFLKDDVNLDFVKKIDEIRKYNPDYKGNNLIDENKSNTNSIKSGNNKVNSQENSEDKFDKLIKLGEMHDKGLLSDEEFASLKQELLSGNNNEEAPVENNVEDSTKYCKNCGAEISSDSVFCTECGTQINNN